MPSTITDIYAQWFDVINVFLIVLAVLIVNVVVSRGLRALARRLHRLASVWYAGLLQALGAPLQGMIWVIGLTLIARLTGSIRPDSLFAGFFRPARDVAVIALVVWFLLRLANRIETGLTERARAEGRDLDPTAVAAISKFARLSILITAILVAMQTLGFSISGILAFGGIGGIAIGFAAQGLVANLFGGLTVFASRPFTVGEWIIMPGTEVMGEVQNIGWRATRVMGFDRRPFYVPNALFNTAVVINHSRMTNRRIMEYLYIRYQDVDKVPAIVSEAHDLLMQADGIEQDFFAFNFDSYGEHALKLLLYAFTTGTDYNEYMDLKQDLLLKLAAIIRRHGAELAIPATNIYLPEQSRTQTDPLLAGFKPAPMKS